MWGTRHALSLSSYNQNALYMQFAEDKVYRNIFLYMYVYKKVKMTLRPFWRVCVSLFYLNYHVYFYIHHIKFTHLQNDFNACTCSESIMVLAVEYYNFFSAASKQKRRKKKKKNIKYTSDDINFIIDIWC